MTNTAKPLQRQHRQHSEITSLQKDRNRQTIAARSKESEHAGIDQVPAELERVAQ
jgi:hypothetical protein